MFPHVKPEVLIEKVQDPPSVQMAGLQAGPWGDCFHTSSGVSSAASYQEGMNI